MAEFFRGFSEEDSGPALAIIRSSRWASGNAARTLVSRRGVAHRAPPAADARKAGPLKISQNPVYELFFLELSIEGSKTKMVFIDSLMIVDVSE